MKLLLTILLIASTLIAVPSTTEYEKLLKEVVCETGVQYENAKNSPFMKSAEQEFLALNKSEFNTLDSEQQISWYSNLYNFYTMKLIVEHYPIKSIQDIKSPWDSKIVPLWGKQVSLNHIEHEILRKEYDEPRVHFALNCASVGCPSLRATPFTGSVLNTQLDEQAYKFLTDSTRNRVKGKKLYLSKIFQWYGADFNNNYGSYQEYVKEVLQLSHKVKVVFIEYDWNLNNASCK